MCVCVFSHVDLMLLYRHMRIFYCWAYNTEPDQILKNHLVKKEFMMRVILLITFTVSPVLAQGIFIMDMLLKLSTNIHPILTS